MKKFVIFFALTVLILGATTSCKEQQSDGKQDLALVYIISVGDTLTSKTHYFRGTDKAEVVVYSSKGYYSNYSHIVLFPEGIPEDVPREDLNSISPVDIIGIYPCH